jgi:hypothetical protein
LGFIYCEEIMLTDNNRIPAPISTMLEEDDAAKVCLSDEGYAQYTPVFISPAIGSSIHCGTALKLRHSSSRKGTGNARHGNGTLVPHLETLT